MAEEEEEVAVGVDSPEAAAGAEEADSIVAIAAAEAVVEDISMEVAAAAA